MKICITLYLNELTIEELPRVQAALSSLQAPVDGGTDVPTTDIDAPGVAPAVEEPEPEPEPEPEETPVPRAPRRAPSKKAKEEEPKTPIEDPLPIEEVAAEPEPAAEPEAPEEPAEDNAPAAEQDGDLLQTAVKRATEILAKGGTSIVKEALAAVGAKRVSEIPEGKIADFLAELDEG